MDEHDIEVICKAIRTRVQELSAKADKRIRECTESNAAARSIQANTRVFIWRTEADRELLALARELGILEDGRLK